MVSVGHYSVVPLASSCYHTDTSFITVELACYKEHQRTNVSYTIVELLKLASWIAGELDCGPALYERGLARETIKCGSDGSAHRDVVATEL